jgi:quercetin dioxygenase-like cupin family protein
MENNHSTAVALRVRLLPIAAYLFYPVGVVRIWKRSNRFWLKALYTIIGLPLFLALALFTGIVLFAAFLPPLDTTVGNRPDRTVFNSDGNYRSTFLKTGYETGGAYELIQVELEPHGGNDWHYHRRFTETFTVLDGSARVGKNGKESIINAGDSATAHIGDMHYFANPTDSIIHIQVRVTPAAGLEKSIRVVYGLANDGLFDGTITKNPWHMALLLGYSGTYLPDIPGFIQEPLVNALAKIAQWRGEDKELEKYFK